MAIETLAAAPSLPRLYAKAVLTARGRGGQLPDTVLRLESARVERDRLLAYQRLCGFAGGDVLPHTYPHLLGFPLQMELMARPDFPLALPGLVHVENTITAHRALTADDQLEVTVCAERLRDHLKGQLVDILTEAHRGGERVWEGRSTYLRRGTAHPVAPAPEPAPDFPEGDPAALWRLPERLGREYAAVSGDVNPIHLHAITARAMGFRSAIAHGMWTYARTLAALGPRTSRPSASQVWFRKPVVLPSAVELVLGSQGGWRMAGLRSARDPAVEHLVLAWRPSPVVP
ncbi:MAG TPA: MaoC/PaaZ C-terminal domain-containing protein [Pedococcus sp.]|nr:MaoC/PaaZ C-terminal domain-containing protein [Pedococcus sp.]